MADGNTVAPAVAGFALPNLSLSQIISVDLFRLYRNTPHCPGCCMFLDWIEI